MTTLESGGRGKGLMRIKCPGLNYDFQWLGITNSLSLSFFQLNCSWLTSDNIDLRKVLLATKYYLKSPTYDNVVAKTV